MKGNIITFLFRSRTFFVTHLFSAHKKFQLVEIILYNLKALFWTNYFAQGHRHCQQFSINYEKLVNNFCSAGITFLRLKTLKPQKYA